MENLCISIKSCTFARQMKKIVVTIGLLMGFVTVWGQTVTNADCYEENQKAVVIYSLDKEANIDLQVSINNSAFQTLDRTSLSGDVGTNVKKGKDKKIVWDVLKDCNSLVGDVQFRVVPSESLNDYNKRIQKENYQRTGYPVTCNSYFKNSGTWTISFMDIGIAGGIKDRMGQVPLYFGLGTFRYKFFEVSLIAFSCELTSVSRSYNSYDYSDSDVYWEPQVRLVLPIADHWSFLLSCGPSLNISASYDRWYFAATARARYDLRFAQTDIFVGYEHHAVVAGLSFSLKWGK